mgnify:CR=1 FL=1
MTGEQYPQFRLLKDCRVWEQAKAFREQIRRKLRLKGVKAAIAADQSWAEMCRHFMPLATAQRDITLTTPGKPRVRAGHADHATCAGRADGAGHAASDGTPTR